MSKTIAAGVREYTHLIHPCGVCGKWLGSPVGGVSVVRDKDWTHDYYCKECYEKEVKE